jgi:hypothetical protein
MQETMSRECRGVEVEGFLIFSDMDAQITHPRLEPPASRHCGRAVSRLQMSTLVQVFHTGKPLRGFQVCRITTSEDTGEEKHMFPGYY